MQGNCNTEGELAGEGGWGTAGAERWLGLCASWGCALPGSSSGRRGLCGGKARLKKAQGQGSLCFETIRDYLEYEMLII